MSAPQHASAIHGAWFDDFGDHLISVSPPDAVIAPGSSLALDARGKVPAVQRPDGSWTGYPWRTVKHSREEVERWTGNLGMRADYLPGVDIDVLDRDVADTIEQLVRLHCGETQCRTGLAPKRLLMYRTLTPMPKRKLVLEKDGVAYAVEVLGAGQQYVIAGIHPKTVKPYEWDLAPHVLGREALPLIGPAQIDAFFAAVTQYCEALGFTVTEHGGGSGERIAVPSEALRGTLEDVTRAVRAIPNDAPDRETFINMAYAIKGALPDHPWEARGLFVEWCGRWSGGINEPDEVEEAWRTANPTRLGAHYLYDMAAKHGDPFYIERQFTFEDAPPAKDAKPSQGSPKLSPSEILDESGLRNLADSTDAAAIEGALRRVRAIAVGLDGLARQTLRQGIITELTRLSIKTPAQFADAALPPPTREREESASGTVALFEEVEPWETPVDGVAVADELVRTFSRFVALPDGVAETVALWVLHAHAFDEFEISPILGITSPTKECGKTRLLDLVGALVPKPAFAANITAATVFRVIERYRPTLLIDEADTFLERNDDLRGVLNSGHRKATAAVMRTVASGDDFEPKQFSTWGPKAIASIGSLPDTLESRSIAIPMRRRLAGEHVEEHRLDRLNLLEPLRRKVARWVQDNRENLRGTNPSMPNGLRDRAADNWRPLLAIADAIGGHWPQSAREAITALSGNGEVSLSAGEMLLADLQAFFAGRVSDRATTAEVLTYLHGLEGRPWAEWRDGERMSAQQLAKVLKPYGINPEPRRTGESVLRGYSRDQFAEAFARYVRPQRKDAIADQLTSEAGEGAADSAVAAWGESQDAPVSANAVTLPGESQE